MGGTLLLLSSQLTSCCPPSVCRVERSLFLCCCLCLIQFVPGLLSGLNTPSAHSLGPWYESLNWGCSVELPSSRLGRPKKGGVDPIGQGLSQPTPALQFVPWEGILKRTHSITWHFEGCLSQTHSLIQENRTFWTPAHLPKLQSHVIPSQCASQSLWAAHTPTVSMSVWKRCEENERQTSPETYTEWERSNAGRGCGWNAEVSILEQPQPQWDRSFVPLCIRIKIPPVSCSLGPLLSYNNIRARKDFSNVLFVQPAVSKRDWVEIMILLFNIFHNSRPG